MRHCYAIDLGTSTIEVSRYSEGAKNVKLIDSIDFNVSLRSDDDNLPSRAFIRKELPAVVYADETGAVFYGDMAIQAGRQHPERLHDFTKRDWVDGKQSRKGFCYTAREVTKLLLEKAVEAIAYDLSELEEGVSLNSVEAIITVPLAYGPKDIKEILHMAHAAGLKKATYFHEARASVCNYIYEREQNAEDGWEEFRGNGKSILVYDMGGGTLDISLVTVKSSLDENKEPKYDISPYKSGSVIRDNVENSGIAGKDVDKKFTDVLYSRFMEETGWEKEEWFTLEHHDYVWKLLNISLAREIKEELENPKTRSQTVYLHLNGGERRSHKFTVRYGKEEYCGALRELFECSGNTPYTDVLTPITNTLRLLKRKMKDIDIILLSGGMGQLSVIKEKIEKLVENEKTQTKVVVAKDPVHAVANGAAYSFHLGVEQLREMPFAWLMDIEGNLPIVIIPSREVLPLDSQTVKQQLKVQDRTKVQFRLYTASEDAYSSNIRCEYDQIVNLKKPVRSNQSMELVVSITSEYDLKVAIRVRNADGTVDRSDEEMTELDNSIATGKDSYYNQYVFMPPFHQSMSELGEVIGFLQREFQNCTDTNIGPIIPSGSVGRWVENEILKEKEKNPMLFLLIYTSKCIDWQLKRSMEGNTYISYMVKMIRKIMCSSAYQEECMEYLITNLRWEPQLMLCLKAVRNMDSPKLFRAVLRRKLQPAFKTINANIDETTVIDPILNSMVCNYLKKEKIDDETMELVKKYLQSIRGSAKERTTITNIGKAAQKLDEKWKAVLLDAFYGRDIERRYLEEGFEKEESEVERIVSAAITGEVRWEEVDTWIDQQIKNGGMGDVIEVVRKINDKGKFRRYIRKYLKSDMPKRTEDIQGAVGYMVARPDRDEKMDRKDQILLREYQNDAPYEYLTSRLAHGEKEAGGPLMEQLYHEKDSVVLRRMLEALYQITADWVEDAATIKMILRPAGGDCLTKILKGNDKQEQLTAAENLFSMVQYRSGKLSYLFDFNMLPCIFGLFSYDKQKSTMPESSVRVRENMLVVLRLLYRKMNLYNRKLVNRFIDEIETEEKYGGISEKMFLDITTTGVLPGSNTK